MKSFRNNFDLLLKEHFLLPLLKTVVLPNIFVETMILFLASFDEKKVQNKILFKKYIFSNNIQWGKHYLIPADSVRLPTEK